MVVNSPGPRVRVNGLTRRSRRGGRLRFRHGATASPTRGTLVNGAGKRARLYVDAHPSTRRRRREPSGPTTGRRSMYRASRWRASASATAWRCTKQLRPQGQPWRPRELPAVAVDPVRGDHPLRHDVPRHLPDQRTGSGKVGLRTGVPIDFRSPSGPTSRKRWAGTTRSDPSSTPDAPRRLTASRLRHFGDANFPVKRSSLGATVDARRLATAPPPRSTRSAAGR